MARSTEDPTIKTPNEDFPSGPWHGFYQQHGRQHPQNIDLMFASGALSGSGQDDVGAFTVRGSYDVATGEVLFRKSYAGSYVRVHYRGFREHKGIWGVWEIPGQGRSGFHIWPLRGTVAADAAAVSADFGVPAPPTPATGRDS